MGNQRKGGSGIMARLLAVLVVAAAVVAAVAPAMT